jgi:hypothetical protein
VGISGAWKLVGLLVAIAVVSFVLGYLVVSRFMG